MRLRRCAMVRQGRGGPSGSTAGRGGAALAAVAEGGAALVAPALRGGIGGSGDERRALDCIEERGRGTSGCEIV
jgi:hypothetical protein